MSEADWKKNGEWRVAKFLIAGESVVFDVGARTDDYLTLVNRDAIYHLFEPMEQHFRSLKRKVDSRQNVFLNQCALGLDDGFAMMFPDTESLSRREMTESMPVSVRIRRLDEYCEERKIAHIDFLKIDTEGHELDVLRGGEKMVRNSVSCIQFEYGGTYKDAGITLRQVFCFLGAGWYAYKILPDRLSPVFRFRQNMEDYEYSNYLVSRYRMHRHLIAGNWLNKLMAFLHQPVRVKPSDG